MSLVLPASVAQSSNYQAIDGAIIDPIQSVSSVGGGAHPYSGANLERTGLLAGVSLFEADLPFADLCGADLANADLGKSNLVDATLRGADLAGANLFGANLAYADLADANLSGANLELANLEHANLSGANLAGANLEAADLKNAQLDRVSGQVIGEPMRVPGRYRFHNGYLVGPGAVLSGANLADLIFVGAPGHLRDLSRMDLTGADLSGADLQDTNLTGVDFAGANLTEADLSGADLTRVNLGGANLTGTTFGPIVGSGEALLSPGVRTVPPVVGVPVGLSSFGTILVDGTFFGPDVDLSGADLSGRNLSVLQGGPFVPAASLASANLAGANLAGVSLGSTDLFSVRGQLAVAPLAGDLPSGYSVVDNYIVGPGADLAGVNLAGRPLAFLNLSGASLAGADLSGSDLTEADLSGADLTGANLSGAILFETNLTGARLSGAQFGGVDLSSATLGQQDWTDGPLAQAPSAIPLGFRSANDYIVGPGSILDSADLSGLTLDGVDLSGATLYQVDLTNTSLHNATFAGLKSASLVGVAENMLPIQPPPSDGGFRYEVIDQTIIGVDVDLSVHSLQDGAVATMQTDLRTANLVGMSIVQFAVPPLLGALPPHYDVRNGVILGNGIVPREDGSAVDLAGADLSFADLSNMVLQNTDLSGANLLGADLSDVTILDGVDLTGVALNLLGNGGASASGLEGAEIARLVGAPAGLPLGFAEVDRYLLGPNVIVSAPSGVSSSCFDDFLSDFRGADLAGLQFAESRFEAANLAGADLSGANLSLSNARAEPVRMNGANLRGAILAGREVDSDFFSLSYTRAIYDEHTVFPSGANLLSLTGTDPDGRWLLGLPDDQSPWDLKMVPAPEPSFGLSLFLGTAGLAGSVRGRRSLRKRR